MKVFVGVLLLCLACAAFAAPRLRRDEEVVKKEEEVVKKEEEVVKKEEKVKEEKKQEFKDELDAEKNKENIPIVISEEPPVPDVAEKVVKEEIPPVSVSEETSAAREELGDPASKPADEITIDELPKPDIIDEIKTEIKKPEEPEPVKVEGEAEKLEKQPLVSEDKPKEAVEEKPEEVVEKKEEKVEGREEAVAEVLPEKPKEVSVVSDPAAAPPAEPEPVAVPVPEEEQPEVPVEVAEPPKQEQPSPPVGEEPKKDD